MSILLARSAGQKEPIGTILQQKLKIPRGKIGGDEAIFTRYAGAESAAYLGYVSIYDTSKVGKEPIGTILQQKLKIPRGKIGGDETIFVLNEGAKAQHSWPM